ncbi:AraC family transcriptional regulator [Georgenia alba]|uniref:AraC family transcriptional regulator n=1 Tax=Georgenia alba TaxID=2233858 RepID=A0ABW2Q5J4_9MICO
MDALADLLDGVQARSAAFCRTVLVPPWALRIADHAPLALATPLRGHAWVVDAGSTYRVGPGDVAVVTGSRPYVVADDPATPADVVVHAGNRVTTLDGREVTTLDPPGGEVPERAGIVASGTYRVTGDVGARLLAALPRVLVVPAHDVAGGVMDLLAAELAHERPGQQVALDRLLDLALLTTLRAWFTRPEAAAPGWYRALGDPVVGRALRLLHGAPSRQWTVESLAREVGSSRAAFARRFREHVGEPPLTYLTTWRLTLAADLLQRTDRTLESIAREVGYSSGFALSGAFRRVRGVSPRDHRTARAALRDEAAVTRTALGEVTAAARR